MTLLEALYNDDLQNDNVSLLELIDVLHDDLQRTSLLLSNLIETLNRWTEKQHDRSAHAAEQLLVFERIRLKVLLSVAVQEQSCFEGKNFDAI